MTDLWLDTGAPEGQGHLCFAASRVLPMDAFRKAVESKDLAAMEAVLAEDVVFSSPAVHKAYAGKGETAVILQAVVRVFEDFRYTRTYQGSDGWVLVFEARVGERRLEGADFVHVNDDGLVDELKVMVRPLSGLNALVAAMGPMIEQVLAERHDEAI